MASRKKTTPVATQAPEPATLLPDLCGAFAFILGASMSAFCRQPKGHEGPHSTEIKVYAEPQAHFVVTWILGPIE